MCWGNDDHDQLDASGSADPEEEPLTCDWDFGDGSTGSGVLVDHVYADEGGYAVLLRVTDPFGRFDVEKRDVEIRNVPPSVDPLPDALLVEGEAYAADGTFTDPGADGGTRSWRSCRSPWTKDRRRSR